MRTRTVALAMGVLLLAIGSGCDPNKNKLLFKPQANAKRTVDTEDAFNFTMDLMGMKLGFGVSGEATYEMTTASVDEQGTSTIDVAIKSITFDMNGLEALLGGGIPGGPPGMPGLPGGAVGDDPFGIKAMQAALRSVQDETFTVKVSKLGEVLEVSGGDALAAKAAAAYKAPKGAPPVSPQELFKDVLGDDMLKQTMENVFLVRPDKKLRTGDTWTSRLARGNAAMNVTQDTTFTFKARQNGTATVDAASQMDFKPSEDLLGSDGPSMKFEVAGQGGGSVTFEESTGWVTDSTSNGTIPGKFSVDIPQMGNMSIPVEISYKTSVKSFPT